MVFQRATVVIPLLVSRKRLMTMSARRFPIDWFIWDKDRDTIKDWRAKGPVFAPTLLQWPARALPNLWPYKRRQAQLNPRYVDRGDVADNPAWRCTETQCSYSVQQRGGLRSDGDRPGWPRSDVLVSPHVLMAWVCGAVEGMLSGRGLRGWWGREVRCVAPRCPPDPSGWLRIDDHL